MYAVHFVENSNVLLTQLLQIVPAEGEEVKIKGRKGKVISVSQIEGSKVFVEVILQAKVKPKIGVDNSKSKKGKK